MGDYFASGLFSYAKNLFKQANFGPWAASLSRCAIQRPTKEQPGWTPRLPKRDTNRKTGKIPQLGSPS